MSFHVRPEISGLTPYSPGLSIDEIRERFGLASVIKLASNENPLGTPPLAQEAVRRHAGDAFRYPQSGNPRLVRAIARHHHVDERRVVVGNGSDEIIDLLIRMLAQPGRNNIVCFDPCFSIYPIQSRICGVEVRRVPVEADFSLNLGKLAALADENTVLAFVTSPDNPSGYVTPAQELRALAAALPAGALLAVDEAYMDFTEDEQAASLLAAGDDLPNVLFLRTFSKSFGLAGIRLGYGILPAALADYYWRARLPFSVNVLAEEAGLAALADTDFRAETLRVVREGRAALTEGFRGLGCTVHPSGANFIMLEPPAGKAAADIFEGLLRRGIIIRPLKSYGLPHMLRVSIGTPEENAMLLRACAELMA
ncbi:MAG: histidinol-phosphate transaminase [Desulfovibrionaceae bacterium]|nr:histidinol-phosphate transaminase [Desulfovibrionaceae bacterium]